MIRSPRSPSPKLHVGNPPQLLQSNEYRALRSRFATPTQGKSQSPPASEQVPLLPPSGADSNVFLPAATNFTLPDTLQPLTPKNSTVCEIQYAMPENVSTLTGRPIIGNCDVYGKFINLYNLTQNLLLSLPKLSAAMMRCRIQIHPVNAMYQKNQHYSNGSLLLEKIPPRPEILQLQNSGVQLESENPSVSGKGMQGATATTATATATVILKSQMPIHRGNLLYERDVLHGDPLSETVHLLLQILSHCYPAVGVGTENLELIL